MNPNNRSAARVSLDWSRLLGFDQVQSAGLAPSVRIGAKVGAKPTATSGCALTRIGAKVGVKPSDAQR